MDLFEITLTAVVAFTLLTSGYSEVRPVDGIAEKPQDDVELGCTTTDPVFRNVSATWFRNNDQLDDTEGKYKIKSDNKLEVKDVEYLEDLGPYVCKFDKSGQTQEETVRLEAVPHVNKFDKSKNLVQGDALTLKCDAYGEPTPNATWFKDGVPLEAGDRITIENNGDVVHGMLKIKDMDYPDAGDYSCEAFNKHGQHNSTITVRVKDKYAALWPFLGICAEVLILCIIIFIYERRRAKKMAEEDAKEEADHLTNSHANRDEVRQRKV